MSTSNFESIKASILSPDNKNVVERQVEVNQRHLIDKILARYSAEFTIYREVLQNADDAGAREVNIDFELSEDGIVKSLTFENNGNPFSNDDWNRLSRIAEGNPDETKIGFFGVGFYSLFSISEEPLVVSGEKCMSFFWKKDQLFTRSGSIDSNSSTTKIHLVTREPFDAPFLDDFAEFIGKSLVFTKNLEKINVLFDGTIQFTFVKALLSRINRSYPTLDSLRKPSSCLFELGKDVNEVMYQLKFIKLYKSKPKKAGIFSKVWKAVVGENKNDQDFSKLGEWITIFSIVNVILSSRSDKNFSVSFERITKKPPSSHVTLSLLIPDLRLDMKCCHPAISNIFPSKSQGKVFIGFETHQTTSGLFHVNAPFVPTVERESIDFVDPVLKRWNFDLFVQIGRLSRLYYDSQAMTDKFDENILRIFGFQVSSPSQTPSNVICENFFTCSSKPILLPSTVGVCSVDQIRSIPEEMKSFLKLTPQIRANDMKTADLFLQNLSFYFTVQSASVKDLISELKSRDIKNYEELNGVLNWISHHQGDIDWNDYEHVKTLIFLPVSHEEAVWKSLSDITFYASPEVETFKYLPSCCLNPKFSKKFSFSLLEQVFEIKRMSILDLVILLSNDRTINWTPSYCEDLLILISESFRLISLYDLTELSNVLHSHPIIPTNKGMVVPQLAFFENVDLLDGIPIIKFEKRRLINDSLLKAIGVKSHLPIADIFANLKDWDYQKLIEYLVQVENDLSDNEFRIIREMNIFNGKKLHELTLSTPVADIVGIPTLRWSRQLTENDKITGFLENNGLNVIIPLEKLLTSIPRLTNRNDQVSVLNYFITHYHSHYSAIYSDHLKLPFVPTSSDKYSSPSHCFSDPNVALLGFEVIRSDLASYATLLKISRRPSGEEIVERFLERNFPVSSASEVFAFIASCQNGMHRIVVNIVRMTFLEFTDRLWKKIKRVPFIPIYTNSNSLEWKYSSNVFFDCKEEEWGKIFSKVDFGPPANSFLRSAGVLDSPSPLNIAEKLGEDAHVIFNTLGQHKYIELLRKLAVNFESIIFNSPSSVSKLKKTKFLVGYKMIDQKGTDISQEEENFKYEIELTNPEDVFLLDDSLSAQLFGLLIAPTESIMESFYRELGSKWVSESINHSWKYYGSPTESNESLSLQKTIFSRAALLCDDVYRPGAIRPDGLSNLKSLLVKCVEKIEVVRVFRNETKTDLVTSCLLNSKSLLIVEKFDFFDVSVALGKIIYNEPKLSDSLLISTLLTMSMSSLRAKGFPTERIIKPSFVEQDINSKIISGDSKPVGDIKMQLEDSKVLTQRFESDMPQPKANVKLEKTPEKSLLDRFKKSMKIFHDSPPPPAEPLSRQMKQILSSTAKASRPYHDSEMFFKSDPVNEKASVELHQDYCELPKHIQFELIATFLDIKLFVDSSLDKNQVKSWVSSNREGLNWFAKILIQIGKCYDLSANQLNIFYAPSSDVIAFNSNHSLFFSVAFYIRQVEQKTTRKTILGSWFVTMAHELAHNFTPAHDKTHEYYMSSYIETFLEAFIREIQ